MAEPPSPDARGERRAVGRYLVIAVAGIGLAIGALLGAPRSMELEVQSPSVCSYKSQTFDRVALVTCEGTGRFYGVANRAQALIPASEDLGAPGSKPVYVKSSTDRGRLRMVKGWFGSYSYSFISEDGIVTELKETGLYIGGVVETLE